MPRSRSYDARAVPGPNRGLHLGAASLAAATRRGSLTRPRLRACPGRLGRRPALAAIEVEQARADGVWRPGQYRPSLGARSLPAGR
jgi:hypothetical protein